ncbi:MAG: hypothetical protein HXY18_18430 [Bryobacteraceae bacterium]|jgi:hypothetical protein|nr:hypothetical protein [Bryobacteraceae bacterium]
MLTTLTLGMLLIGPADPSQEDIRGIIEKFAAKEAEFARARENYTYRQRYRIEELSPEGRPMGKLEMEADIIFNADGKRTERVTFAPMNTLQRLQMTPQDEEDLRSVQPFVLTTKDIPFYKVTYMGRENVDEISCYVFAVKPKSMEPGKRYFAGTVWVDDRDLQIVKTYGRGVGIEKKSGDHKYPKFETYREQIDGKFWFPTYTVANDTLNFESGPVPIKMVVTYKDYKQFKAESTITFGDAVEDKKPADPPKKQ